MFCRSVTIVVLTVYFREENVYAFHNMLSTVRFTPLTSIFNAVAIDILTMRGVTVSAIMLLIKLLLVVILFSYKWLDLGKIIRKVLTQLHFSGGSERSPEAHRAGIHVVWSTEQLLGSRVQENLFCYRNWYQYWGHCSFINDLESPRAVVGFPGR